MKNLFKRSVLLFVVLLAFAAAASAQNPIRWRMSVKMTSKTEGIVTLRAVIDSGWHLYGFDLPDDGPRPTSVSFDKSEGIVFTGDLTPERKPVEKDDPMFGVRLAWWDSNISFTRKFKLAKGKIHRLEANINFMGCNDQTCLPPRSESLVYNSFDK